MPAYLKAVTLLEPRGNVPAAVAAAVARLSAPPWQRFLRRWAALLVVLLLSAVIGAVLLVRETTEQTRIRDEDAENIHTVQDILDFLAGQGLS
jgi:predicted PurR-regulated permease PerM